MRGHFLTLLILVAAAAAATARAADAEFNIEAQPLASALATYAQQADLQVLFPQETVRNLQGNPVRGKLDKERALELLLDKTGLQASFAPNGTVLVRAATPSVLRDGMQETGAESRLAQLDQPASSQGEGQGEDVKNKAELPADDRPGRGIPEILVRGKKNRTLNADIERTRDDVRPYVILSRETIERSAARDIDELLRRQLPMNYVQISNNQTPSSDSLGGGSSRIALRGLSGGETLILIDGRRTARTMLSTGSDEAQANINNIPLSAIERIEILPASASGIYGGQATGGVVNVILRRDYSGIETSLYYQNSFEGGGATQRMDVFGGTQFGEVAVQVSASLTASDPLYLGDRNYVIERRNQWQNDQVSRRPSYFFNAANPLLGAVTNVSSATQRFDPITGDSLGLAPLTLKGGRAVGSTITSVPIGYKGISTDSGQGFINQAGRYNVDLADSAQAGGAKSSLLGGPRVASLDITVRNPITLRTSSFFEASVSRTDQQFASDTLAAVFLVPVDAPTNPFEQDIVVNAPLSRDFNANGFVRTRADTGRILGGLNIELGSGWSTSLESSYSVSQSEQTAAPRGIFADGATAAVETGAIDLLRPSDEYAAALGAFTLPPNRITPTHSRFTNALIRAAGPLYTSRAGDIKLSMLAEGGWQYFGRLRREFYRSNGTLVVREATGGQSNVASLYSELAIPLASDAAPLFGMHLAELQLAGRYDKYDQRASFLRLAGDQRPESRGEFDSTVPTLGLRFSPIDEFVIRASFGKGFLPPYLSQLQEEIPSEDILNFLTDPKRGGEPLGVVTIRSGGNPDLKPETSKTRSAGIIFTPRAIDGLRFSFDWTSIEKRNNILGLSFSQNTINSEDIFPGVVVREQSSSASPGRITEFNIQLRNVLRSVSESYDLSADYAFSIGTSNFTVSSSATRLLHNRQQQSQEGDEVEFSGTASYPSWAGNATVTWSMKDLSMTVAGRYFDSHSINDDRSLNLDQGAFGVPSRTVVDFSAEYFLRTRFAETAMRFGIKNVFNERPRYLAQDLAAHSDFWDDPMRITYFLGFRASILK